MVPVRTPSTWYDSLIPTKGLVPGTWYLVPGTSTTVVPGRLRYLVVDTVLDYRTWYW